MARDPFDDRVPAPPPDGDQAEAAIAWRDGSAAPREHGTDRPRGALGAARIRRRPVARRAVGLARGRAVRFRAPRARRHAKRHRPLSLLAHGGDRRRSRYAASSVPRRDRELAARHEHRFHRAQRQRVPRRYGAHHRPPSLEQARRHGDRPLPARRAPRGHRDLRRLGGRRGSARHRDRQRRRGRAGGPRRPAALVRAPLRSGGAGPVAGGTGCRLRSHRDHAVRLDPIDERERRRRRQHVRVVSSPRGGSTRSGRTCFVRPDRCRKGAARSR